MDERVERLSTLLKDEGISGLDFRLSQSSDETGEYYVTEATVFCDQNPKLLDLISADGDWSDTTLALFCNAVNLAPDLIAERSRLLAALEEAEGRLAKAEGDRDALRGALGFIPGPLKDERDDDIVILDAKALRPAMAEARRQRDEAQIRNAENHCYAAEEIRAWVKERFGKWITYKTAGTLADRIFGSDRAAPTTKSGEA